jgi:excisionase family DNA binding protein
MNLEPILVSIPDAARMLGIGRTKTYDLLLDGSLEAVNIGTRRLVKLESVKALADGGA